MGTDDHGLGIADAPLGGVKEDAAAPPAVDTAKNLLLLGVG